MIYRSSFNGLEVEVKGVYSVYNVTDEEFDFLRRRFHDKINGSNGNYTIYESAARYVWVKLYVHDQWFPIKFDIRGDMLKLLGKQRIYAEQVEDLSKILKSKRLTLKVDYDVHSNTWTFIDKDELLKIIKETMEEEILKKL